MSDLVDIFCKCRRESITGHGRRWNLILSFGWSLCFLLQFQRVSFSKWAMTVCLIDPPSYLLSQPLKWHGQSGIFFFTKRRVVSYFPSHLLFSITLKILEQKRGTPRTLFFFENSNQRMDLMLKANFTANIQFGGKGEKWRGWKERGK